MKKEMTKQQLLNSINFADILPSTSINPMSESFTLENSNSYSLLSLNRIVLSYTYLRHGIIQTAIDQPIEDAFRGGVIIKSDELDNDDIMELQNYLELSGFYSQFKEVLKWKSLYGGAGLIINTPQDPSTPFDLDSINKNTELDFIPADRWELLLKFQLEDKVDVPYSYYGQAIHKSRVMKFKGKEAPSYIRKQLQGWGMSEVERMLRNINSYIKNQNVIFELLDEAKIDVFKIQGFNDSLMSARGQNAIKRRLELATLQKNYQNSLAMDKEDDYEQKQISYAGLGEMLTQNRIGIASDLKMPLTKLFGLSSAGFNSGDDDIENYNSLVETEIRSPSKMDLIRGISICCKKIFEFIPDFTIDFHPLRILGAVEEENVKNSKFNRVIGLYDRGLIDEEKLEDILKTEELFNYELNKEAQIPESSADFDVNKVPIRATTYNCKNHAN